MLEVLKASVHAAAPEWVAAAAKAKGLRPDSPLRGEEWISGPWAVLYAVNRYLRTLRAIARRGASPIPKAASHASGRTVLKVFPHSLYDRALLSGISAQVWLQPGVTPQDAAREAAPFYQQPRAEGSVTLVLGAGNISSIPPLDVLYKLCGDGSVCMLKMNPVNDYLGPIFERVFGAFVNAGYLRFAYGGVDAGRYLCAHELVDDIHITGSESTYQTILANMTTRKPMTSELGNVSPTIVFPGPWSDDDVSFQAENIASQKAHNAGFNCIASQVLIVPGAWKHTPALRERIGGVFERMEQRPEYYPGASTRRARLAGDGKDLRTIVLADPAQSEHPAFTTEAFCGVLASVELPGGIRQYVRDAVAFANDRLHGTLGVNLVIHPATIKEHRALVDEAIAELRYGCVAVNGWTGIGYFLTETPWGAYRGETTRGTASGTGVVHNSYFLTRTEKSVIYAPFAPFPRSVRGGELSFLPRPPWFVTNSMQAEIGRALCDFELAPSPGRAMRVAVLAMRA